jgi:hypothetical protein
VINRSRIFNTYRSCHECIQHNPTNAVKWYCKIIGLTLSTIPKPSSAANLLTNGDFEIEPNWGGGVSYDGGYTTLIGSQLLGWTIELNHAVTIHISPGSYLVISNAYSANTDGQGYNGHNANFYQDFGSTPGAYYALAFDWQSWVSDTTPTTSQLKISVVDTVTSDVLFNGLYTYDGSGAHPVHHIATNFFGSGATLRLRIEESPESGYNDNTFVVDNFSVTEGWPLLRVTQSSPSQATLSWPTNTAGFVLETTPVLPASTWITVTNVPVIGSNSLFNFAVATTNAQQFFRLQHQ